MASRGVYLEFLRENELSEEQVLPAAGDELRQRLFSKEGAEAVANTIASQDLKGMELLQHALNLVNGNSNTYLAWLDRELRAALLAISPTLGWKSKPLITLYPGVFPINDYNARLVPTSGSHLLLMNTGMIQMNEAVCSLAASERSLDEKASILSLWVKRYATTDIYPSYEEQDHPSIRTRLRNFVACRTTRATQEFVLAHEYGHAVLHAGGSERASRHMCNGRDIEVVGHSVSEEFEADLWSVFALSSYIRQAAPADEYALALQLAGPIIFLSTWYLVERYRETALKHQRNKESHPPAGDRICAVEAFMRAKEFDDAMWLGGDYLSVVERACQDLFDESGIMPIWDREIVRRVRAFCEKCNIPAKPVMGWE